MAFTVLSWNVEDFKGIKDIEDIEENEDYHPDEIAQFIKQFNPEVIAIYELLNSNGGYRFAQEKFPDYLTFITEGQNNQEIMILIKSESFQHVTITQQHKFKIGNPFLRPGALVTLTQQNDPAPTNILFLHSASGTLADAFGDRMEIASHIFNLNERLQEIEVKSGVTARLIVTGDFNTMGLQFPRKLVSHRVQKYQDEIKGFGVLADRAHIDNFQGMSFAPKEHDLTFSNPNDRDQSDLDHVLISSGIQLADLGNRQSDGLPYQVAVRGWIQRPSGDPRNEFIEIYSDHCALVFTVQ